MSKSDKTTAVLNLEVFAEGINTYHAIVIKRESGDTALFLKAGGTGHWLVNKMPKAIGKSQPLDKSTHGSSSNNQISDDSKADRFQI